MLPVTSTSLPSVRKKFDMSPVLLKTSLLAIAGTTGLATLGWRVRVAPSIVIGPDPKLSHGSYPKFTLVDNELTRERVAVVATNCQSPRSVFHDGARRRTGNATSKRGSDHRMAE